jgi:hypothetical protein
MRRLNTILYNRALTGLLLLTGTGASQTLEQGKLPLSFEPNSSRTDPAVKFLHRSNGSVLFLIAGGAVLTLRRGKNI